MTTYSTGGAFLTALNTKLRSASKASGQPITALRRQYLTHRFLARLFASTDSGWVLVGGTSLLIRLNNARHSRDIDLLLPQSTIDEAVAQIKIALAANRPDRFEFDLKVETFAGLPNQARLRVIGRVGPTRFDAFPIDLNTERVFIGNAEQVQPTELISIDDVEPLPEFALYPLAQHLADKFCAMYETHGPANPASTRFHDLVDIVLIIRESAVDLDELRTAISAETRRRGITLPTRLSSPGPNWTAGYRTSATTTALPTELHSLDTALAVAHTFVTPALDLAHPQAKWDPGKQSWVNSLD